MHDANADGLLITPLELKKAALALAIRNALDSGDEPAPPGLQQEMMNDLAHDLADAIYNFVANAPVTTAGTAAAQTGTITP